MLKLKFGATEIAFIGDPHLGKKFPRIKLHRQGEREYQQINTFLQQLMEEADVTIMVGDLFDTYNVPNEVLLDTYTMILHAAEEFPDRLFIMMNGNHDVARDENIKTSFQVLEALLQPYKNVQFITTTQTVGHKDCVFLVCPYKEFSTAAEEVAPITERVSFAVGHWDVDAISGPHNLVPLEHLSTITSNVITGHIHSGDTKKIGNVTLYRTGSMLPYSHSEDENEMIYVSRTLEDLKKELAANPTVYEDKCVRLLLKDGEELPEDFECMQFTIKKIVAEDKQEEKLEVESLSFDFKNIFIETFKSNDLSDEIANQYWEEYKKLGGDDAN